MYSAGKCWKTRSSATLARSGFSTDTAAPHQRMPCVSIHPRCLVAASKGDTEYSNIKPVKASTWGGTSPTPPDVMPTRKPPGGKVLVPAKVPTSILPGWQRGTALNPFDNKTKYDDSPIDRAFITLVSSKLAEAMAIQGQMLSPPLPALCTYDDLIRVSKAVMKNRSPDAQAELVRGTLHSLLPKDAVNAYRSIFPASRWTAEVNAFFASQGFFWLVGETELKEGSVRPGEAVANQFMQQSTVHIKKCRYLEESGCVAICNNLCKTATQRFFTEDVGMPLTMVPNWDDLSCDMVFGQVPLPRDQDEAYLQPCFKNHCSVPDAVAALSPCKLTLDPKEKRKDSMGSLKRGGAGGSVSAAPSSMSRGSASASASASASTSTSNWGLNGAPPPSMVTPSPKTIPPSQKPPAGAPAMRPPPPSTPAPSLEPSQSPQKQPPPSTPSPFDFKALSDAASKSMQQVMNQSSRLPTPPPMSRLLDLNAWKTAIEKAGRQPVTAPMDSASPMPGQVPPAMDSGVGQQTLDTPVSEYPNADEGTGIAVLEQDSSSMFAAILASVVSDTNTKYIDAMGVKALPAPAETKLLELPASMPASVDDVQVILAELPASQDAIQEAVADLEAVQQAINKLPAAMQAAQEATVDAVQEAIDELSHCIDGSLEVAELSCILVEPTASQESLIPTGEKASYSASTFPIVEEAGPEPGNASTVGNVIVVEPVEVVDAVIIEPRS